MKISITFSEEKMQQRCLEEAAAFLKENHDKTLSDDLINDVLDNEFPRWKDVFIQESSQYFCDVILSSGISKKESIKNIKEFLCIESYELKEGN